MRILLPISLLLIAGCARNAETTPVPASERDVRLLDANDVALRPVVFAAAKHLFDPNASQILAFGGVVVNKKVETSLSNDVNSYLVRIGGLRQASKPAACDQAAAPPGRSRGPATGASGGAPNPSSQPTRTMSGAICNRGADVIYTFTSTRIASDTAYVEVQVAGVAASTKCLALTVDKDAGGWTPGDMKTSKIGQCGK